MRLLAIHTLLMQGLVHSLHMKATDVIRRDHRAAESLFTQYKEATSEEEKDMLAHEIFKALTAHEMMEDTYFYPRVLEVATDEDKAAFDELEDEQGELERETLRVRAITIFVDRDRELLPLMDKVLAHAKREESVILDRADELLDDATNESLGDEMEPHSAVAKADEV